MSLFSKARPTRRDVLKQSGVLSAAAVAAPLSAHAATLADDQPARTGLSLSPGTPQDNIFTKLGVRPIVNAHGTFTIITGSRSLPEVKQAMYEASFYFVHLDELMDKVGADIAQMLGAPGCTVTTGCEAAIALATVACSCGTNVEWSQAFPYKRLKSQVIIPKHSRNPYDFGVRMTGAEIVEVDSAEEFQAKLTDKVAMVYVLASPAAEKGPLSVANICQMARAKNVPVFVDAAAEEPLVPNKYIQAGANLVGYSGGKCMRGPQAAGLLLGDKELTKAAWFQASPHHNYGRAYKVGKEEIMGIRAAVQQWGKRDHAAEQKMWMSWLKTIEARLKPLQSTTFEYLEPEDLSNRSPRLRVHWDANVLKITGTELTAKLDAGNPRVMLDGGTGIRPENMASSLTVMPYMMSPGEEKIVADAIFAALSHPDAYSNPVIAPGASKVEGKWHVAIQYLRGKGEQEFELKQSGSDLSGTQKGELFNATLKGSIHGNDIKLRSTMPVSGHQLDWNFKGTVAGDTASGSVDLGEYGKASWQARKA
ncbi:selenocysteine synthase (seryl-tRNASer selenium transferase) [Terriglobus roseus DSM 18391]|uniref:Selenocysteine synthase (Seryl-tRNASer selenium transferase) n=1 Tax=Terriglobus roseus (strain DSM 18391 / NRRL B-41598 / KBS 63) TaxID=926566 RepID=I3ZHC1_TERRK|nr:PLP-dependent transferase [Terriglobus roseus]AFL88639.1 selenocysteine synthase (seryl-tRNASer selenium transferase) [Terriglobus roseus DSM 18391]